MCTEESVVMIGLLLQRMWRTWFSLTYDSTVFTLKSWAWAGDGPTRAGAAERGAACCAVERGTWAVSAGRRRATGQCGAGADTLACDRALERKELEKRVELLYINNMLN